MKLRTVDLVKGLLFALLCISISLRSHAQTKVISAGGTSTGGGGGSGTVESVAATVPAYMTLTGSPITTTGTLAFGFATQAQGTIFAGPCTGTGAVTFRALCAADIPASLTSNTSGNAATATNLAANPTDCTSGQYATAIGANGNLTCAAIQASELPATINANTTGNAATASNLAANPTDCSAGTFATTIASSGNLTCAALASGDIPNPIASNTSGTASALAANGTNCTAPNFARGVDASGNCEGEAIVASDLPNTTVTPGSYTAADITVDAQGRITAAASGSSGGVTSLNSLTGALTIAAGTTGSDVNVAASGSTVTVHVPDASATARGAVTTGTQTLAGAKTFSSTLTTNGVSNSGTLTMVTGDVQFNLLTQKVNIAGAAHYQADASSNAVVNSYGEIDLKPGAISSGTGRGTRLFGANGAYWFEAYAMELITLSTSGTTTDSSANLLPANSIIQGVTCRVTTTITTATDWSVGDPTTAARFSSANATLTSGTTSVGLNHHAGSVSTDAAGPTQATAAKLRITTTGTPGAGAVRCTVFYSQFSPPTS